MSVLIFHGCSCRFGWVKKILNKATPDNCCQLNRVNCEPAEVGRMEGWIAAWAVGGVLIIIIKIFIKAFYRAEALIGPWPENTILYLQWEYIQDKYIKISR